MTNFDRFHRKAGGVQAGGVNALAGVLFIVFPASLISCIADYRQENDSQDFIYGARTVNGKWYSYHHMPYVGLMYILDILKSKI